MVGIETQRDKNVPLASVVLPSVASHLLQLLGGQCCHLGASLLQSSEFSWTQDCEHQSRTETGHTNIQNILSDRLIHQLFKKKTQTTENTNTSTCYSND